MSKRVEQRERLATAEAAIPAAEAETPATQVALPPSSVPDAGIPSWVQPVTHPLLVGDSDQTDARPESGQVGVACFVSKNLVLNDSERFTRAELFQCLPVHAAFDAYYQPVGEVGK